MIKMLGIKYGRGCLAVASDAAPSRAPESVKQMFPDLEWTMVLPSPFDADECKRDRFGENFKIQQKIFDVTPTDKHILIGGDHSVNYGHFAKLADCISNQDLCLVYIDAHMDLHTPETSVTQASGAPHGANVRALLGQGDERWLSLTQKHPALRPENLFYLATRSTEQAEDEYANKHNIYVRHASELQTKSDIENAISEVRKKIGNRPYVVSFDFDAIDPKIFSEVLVPAPNGITFENAEMLVRGFHDASYFEFVEYAPSGDKTCEKIVNQLISLAIGE